MKNKLIFIACFVVLGALLGLRSYWIGMGEDRTQAKWDAANATTAQAAIEHQKEQITKHFEKASQLKEENERINQNDYNRAQIMQAHIDELNFANERLQHTIDQQNTRINRLSAAGANPGTCPAPDDTAAARGRVLAECPAEYAKVASDAERLSRQVAGLQDYARLCQQQQP